MSSYASGAKLSELTLAGDPAPAVDAPAVKEGTPASVAAADQVALRTTHSSVVKASLLHLTDAPAETVEVHAIQAGTRAPEANAGGDPNSRNTDEFLAAAARELETGELDQPLWAKAIELAGNDAEVAKPAYVRARAAALRVAKQKKRAEMRAQRAQELAREEKEWSAPRPASPAPPRRVMLIGGALGVGVVVLVTGFLVFRPAGEPPLAPALSASAQGTKTGQATPSENVKPEPKAASPERPSASSDDFAKRVAEFKAAGNWNVLVLYAVEWTRKIPDSADAWNELSMGYVRLHQFSDALDAGTKVVLLAPKSFQAWQNLGEINVALHQPAAALIAYEQAAALNGRDVTSLVQIGMLNAELGHLPEAKAAFTQALDVSPLDADALCGASAIAQKEGHPKDVEAVARQLKTADIRCREAVSVAPVSVAASAVPKNKPSASATR